MATDIATRTAQDLVAASVTADKAAFVAAWASIDNTAARALADNDGADADATYKDVCIALLAQVRGLVGAVAEHLETTPAAFLAAVHASRAPRTNGNHP
jgi:hypothetical protein